jgi:hypothetical protein
MFIKRFFNLLAAFALVAVLVLTIREAAATTSITHTNPDTVAVEEMQRARKAEAARLTGLAEHYYTIQAQETLRLNRVRAAESARLTGLAEYTSTKQAGEALRQERVRAAEAARLNGLGQYYLTKQALETSGNR